MNLIFDFDGTLVDSMPTWAGVHINMLKSHGIEVPEGFVETITPLGNRKASEYTISLGVNLPLSEYLEKISKILCYEYLNNVPLKSNVCEFLNSAYKAGHTLSVLTASPHLYVDDCLKKLGVYSLFSKVWTIEDFNLTKAQPEIYVEAARRLLADVSECVFFDDNYTAIKTAASAGMKTVGVYDDSSRSYKAQIEKIADYYITEYPKEI
jgi:HAD superfamily hydrolase (TIGR01509 family)